MKRNSTLVKTICLTATVAAFTQCSPKNENAPLAQSSAADSLKSVSSMNIAYVNVDSLLSNYVYAKELSEAYLRKTENYRASMNEKVRSFEKDMADFQRKVENNAFLSQQRMQDAQNTLMKKRDDIQSMESRISQELYDEQQRINAQLSDSVNAFLKEYNQEKKFEMIISNTAGDNILIAQPKYNITQEVTDRLNQRYIGKK